MVVFSLVLVGVLAIFFGPAKTMAAIAIVLLALYRPVESIAAVLFFLTIYYLFKRRF